VDARQLHARNGPGPREVPAATAGAAEFLIRTAGHVLRERRRLEAEGLWPDLVNDLEGLVRQRTDGGGRLALDYLLALARPA
jgi:hypothetical protein